MELSKPKEFKLKPKPKLPGVTVWGDQTANRQPMIRPQFHVQMLQEFNVSEANWFDIILDIVLKTVNNVKPTSVILNDSIDLN